MKEAICKCLKRTALLAFSLLFVWGGAFGARAEEKEEVTISNILISENGKPVSGNPVFELEYPDGMKKEYITANGFLADLKLYKSEVHKLRLKDEMSYEMEELRIKAEVADALQTESGESVLEIKVRRKENVAEQAVELDVIFVRAKDGNGNATIPLTFLFRDVQNDQVAEYQSVHAILDSVRLILGHRYELSLKENYNFTMEKQIVKVGDKNGSYVLLDERDAAISEILISAKGISNEELLTRVKKVLTEKIGEVQDYLNSKKFSKPEKVEELRKTLDEAKASLEKENESLDNLENHLVKIDLKFRGIKDFEIKEEKKPEEPKQENPQKPEEPKQENPQKPEEPKKPQSEQPKKEEKKQENPPSQKPEKKNDKGAGNTGKSGNTGNTGKSGNTSKSGRGGRSGRSTGRSTQKGKVQINTRAIAKKAEKTENNGMWVQDQKGWWYRNMDGSYPKSSWLQDKGKWYYFDAQGYMAKGWVEYTGKWYYLAEDGAMAVSTTTPDGYKVDATGAWIS